MKHIWKVIKEKDKSFKEFSVEICKTCGLKKLVLLKDDTIRTFTRSGIVMRREPVCIDEKEENAKTID